MKLLYAAASPFVRKVRVVAAECGLDDRIELVSTAAGPGIADDALKAINPLAKLPTLVREDGPALFDSRTICRYLDDLGQGGLYPETSLWEVLTLEALGDGICDAAVLMVYEARFRSDEEQSESWVEAQWARVARSLDALESVWISHLAGPLDIGQIAVACALEYLDFRHPDRNWRASHPSLADWHAGIKDRTSMQDTIPSG